MPLALSKVIDLDDFASADLRPYLQEINGLEAARFGAAAEEIVPDSKQWSCAMVLRALDLAGAASEGCMIAGIGAGTEPTLFALARRGALVFAADRYLHRTRWSDVAPAGMLVDPAQYCDAEVPPGRVIAVQANALKLHLPSNAFDAVFCCAAIECLGSLDAVAVAAREIGRLLKPGGVAAFVTEYRVEGPADRRGFHDDVILFTPQTLSEHVVAASGLTLREPIVTFQSDATFETRRELADFRSHAATSHGLDEKRASQPNLVLYHDGFLFCPVALTLHKDRPTQPMTERERATARQAAAEVDAENAALAADLESYQRMRDAADAPAESHLLFGEVERLRVENEALRAAYDRSNAWKRWPVMRPARFVYRRVKRLRG